MFDEAVGGGEDGGVDAAEAEDLGPKPLAGIDATAFGEILRAHPGGRRRDFGGFGVGGVPLEGSAYGGAMIYYPSIAFTANEHSVSTSYFEVLGRLRLGSTTVLERSLVQRDGINVRTLWRERAVADPAGQARP